MVVTVQVLGDFAVAVDGRPVSTADFARRSGALLVKLLALQPSRRMHREQVMDALWPEASGADAANSLHKAAHFARRATGASDCIVLRQELVSLFPARDVRVDIDEFEAAARLALSSGDDVAAAVALERCSADLLPDEPYATWASQVRQRVGVLRRELLRQAGRWAELVELDATDEQAALGLAQELVRRGDRTGALREIDRIEAVLRDELGIGLSPEGYDLRITALDSAVSVPAVPMQRAAPRYAGLATQSLGFCRARDGVRLAYATSGSGPALVKVANWMTHLDYDWASPVWSHWWHELSRDFRLIRYDERGCGMSDWDVDSASFSLDAWVADLETVVDTLGLERFPLLGISQGGPIAIAYAARHPERVSHLVVYGTCARPTWVNASEEERRQLYILGQLLRQSWGSDEPGFRQIYDARFLPDGPLELWRAFDQLQRRSASPTNAYRLWRAFGHLDITDAAPHVTAPTLVLHSKDELVWTFREAEEVHSMIPGSRLVALPSRNHILRGDEPAFAQLLQEIRRFLGV